MHTTTLPLNVGFAIGTSTQEVIDDNFREEFGRDATETDWDTLREDILQIERNAVNFLRRKLGAIRDEGHSDDDLIGTCWVDWSNRAGLEYVHGYYEEWHPHALDTETGTALIEGTSRLASVIDPEISFFNIDPPDDMERLEAAISGQKGRTNDD